MYEEAIKAIKEMDNAIEKYRDLRKTNPELAKQKAMEDLQRKGILDENGNLKFSFNQMIEEDSLEKSRNFDYDGKDR